MKDKFEIPIALRATSRRILGSITPHLCNDNISEYMQKGDLKEIEENVEHKIEELLEALLLDWRRDHNMKDTPKRVAKMFIHEIFRGRYYSTPKMTAFPNVKKYDQLYAVGPIDVKSTCAHHLLPFTGRAYIGLLLDEKSKICGLSKFNRIVDHFARRPQIQEELTAQIANDLKAILKPKGLIVLIKAKHMCMCVRGVNQNSDFTTSIALDAMRDNSSLKDEFFSLIGNMSL
jgi:GTP cyclohydrolase I